MVENKAKKRSEAAAAGCKVSAMILLDMAYNMTLELTA